MIDWGALVAMILCFFLAWKWMDRGRFGLKGRQRQLQELPGVVGKANAADVELAKLQLTEQRERRALYDKLASEKLDVLRTALTMGYKEDELSRLDARLEKLIGTDKLDRLLVSGDPPSVNSDLLDTDLDAESNRLRSMRAAEKSK